MGLLLDLSRPDAAPPLPADTRLCALGFAAWETALGEAEDQRRAVLARVWSGTPAAKRLLAAIFGNSPFLSGLAIAEWTLLIRLVEDGADAVFDEIVAATGHHDAGENQASVMRRLRLARRRAALIAAAAELAGMWSLEQQMTALSHFAEAAIGAAVRHLLWEAASRGSIAPADAAAPEKGSGLIVLGMGKLGGGELNYSS